MLIKKYALYKHVRLLTRFYGSLIKRAVKFFVHYDSILNLYSHADNNIVLQVSNYGALLDY